MIFRWLIELLWVVFLAYWLFSSIGVKRTRSHNGKSILIRLLIAAVFVIVAKTVTSSKGTVWETILASTPPPAIQAIGVILAAVGVACAIWARVHLGKNWGMPMSIKEDPELVMSGPYAYVRHPIYTGVLLVVIGSACVFGLWWLLALILYAPYFIYSARTEEKIMRAKFPDQYPDYMKRTKMLIPFVF